MADAYARFAVEFEADLSGVQAGLQGGLSMARLYGNQYAGGFMGGVTEGLGNLSGGLDMFQGLKARFSSTAQGLSEIFGLKAGSEMAYFRRQLVGMTGDAATAERTLAGLVDIANKTSYGNMDIFQLATNALGSGTTAQNLIPETGNILDAAAGIGINDPAVFRRFARNLFDIRGKEGMASQRDVNELYRQAPQFVFQAAKVLGVSAQGARDQINGMSGQDLYALITRIGEANKGRASAEGMADPFVAAANAADQLKTALAPTGELVNRFLTPMVANGARLAGIFAEVNKLGAGIPGLVVAISLTVGLYRLHQATIGRTTMALNALAAAAGRAAGAQTLVAGGMLATSTLGGPGGAAAASNRSRIAKNVGMVAGAVGASWMVMSDESGIGQRVLAEGRKGDKMEKAADKLEKAADKLATLDSSSEGYGIGKRGKFIQADIEAGYALFGAQRLGGA